MIMECISFCIVFVVFVASTRVSAVAVSQTLSVTNANTWGDWGDAQFCGEDTYAVGYNMKIEGRQGGDDDTALNGIKLICQSPYSHESRGGVATSSVGPWGNWVGEALCENLGGTQHFLTSFRLQSEGRILSYYTNRNDLNHGQHRSCFCQGGFGFGSDDTSANFIKFKCRDVDGHRPPYEMSKAPGYGEWGSYGNWSSECRPGTAICGIQTRVEIPQGMGDNTALNDVVFYCCN